MFNQLFMNGLISGTIYALTALGFVIIYNDRPFTLPTAF